MSKLYAPAKIIIVPRNLVFPRLPLLAITIERLVSEFNAS
jgi:hypothetical protein